MLVFRLMIENEAGAGPEKRLSVRIGDKGYRHIERRAKDLDVPISRMVRRLLAYASLNMPKNWTPSTAAPRTREPKR